MRIFLGDIDGVLPIKFWEIEVSDDPQEKWWAGCVLVRADRIKRPIPEGTEPWINTRAKMGQTSNVIALVKAGDKYYYAAKEVKVTLGGCGG